MKTSNIHTRSLRVLFALTLGLICSAGLAGTADAATCFTCHAPLGSSTDIRPVESTYRNITTGSIRGSHAKHIPAVTVDANTCTPCHGSVISSTNHRNGFINVTSATAPGLSYSKGSKFAQSGAANLTLGTCSSASCHANVYGSGTVVSPVWGTAAANCTACHTTPIGANGPATGSHTNTAGHAVACTSCHAAGTTATTPPTAGHNDGYIGVANVGYATLNKVKGTAGTTCSAASCHASPVSAALVVTPAWGTTGNGCAACHSGVNAITATGPATGSHGLNGHAAACTSCHAAGTTATVAPSTGHRDGDIDVANVGYATLNKVKGTAGTTCSAASCHASPVAATLITTPAWGSTGNGCAACHTGANLITANGPATGSHTNTPGHAVACISCHAAGTTATSAPGTGHADGDIDVANVGYATLNKVKGTAGTTCSAASCHDNGKGVFVTSPAWGSKVPACTACHALQPADSSHSKHLTGLAVNFNRNANCNDCHNGTTQGVVAGAGHLDGDIDVSVGNYPVNKAKGTVGASCTTAVCHSNGSAVYKSAQWGTTNAAGCNFCHDALPTSGSHTIHIGGTANYSFGCAECHGHNGTGTAHNNGVINIVGTIGYNGSKQCATSDCHSDGKVTLAYKVSPAWGGSFTGDRCAGCHGNWPSGDAHLAHAVGIHYDDVSSKTGGKIASSATVASAVSAGHGDARYSTTISCYICHNTTVTAAFNDNSPTCSTASCHTAVGAGGLKGALTTASLVKATHVNRVRDVSFANTTVKSKAQLRDDITLVADLVAFWTRMSGYKVGASSYDESKVTLSASASFAAGSCANVVCHNGNAVNWTTGVGITCDKCHTGLPQ